MKNVFVIVTYNDYETTYELIQNIKDYSILDKIIIVDNHSSDNSYEKLVNLKNDKVSVIQSDENKGYAYGMNIGSKYAIKKYGKCNIIFSNADIVIDKEEDIQALVRLLESNSSYGIVAPVIKEHEGLNRGWKIPTPLQDAVLNILYIHRILRPRLLFYDENYYNGTVEVDAVSGCFFCMNSKTLEEVGFFDENTFLYYEENIIAKKLKKKNYKVMLQSDVSVFHNHAVIIDKNIHSIKKFKILKESQLYFQKEYNHANVLQIGLLHITNKLSLCILYVTSMVKKIIS